MPWPATPSTTLRHGSSFDALDVRDYEHPPGVGRLARGPTRAGRAFPALLCLMHHGS